MPSTVILFPSEMATDLHVYDSSTIKTAFFIDGTWNQAKSIADKFAKATFVRICRLPLREPCSGDISPLADMP